MNIRVQTPAQTRPGLGAWSRLSKSMAVNNNGTSRKISGKNFFKLS